MLAKKLKNFTAFVDGRGYAGKIKELEPPKLTLKMEEYRAGGMDAATEIDMGMEKLESTLTFSEYDKEIFKQFGLTDGNAVALTLRGAMEDDTTTEEIVIQLRGRYKSLETGSWKAGDDATLKATVSCRYYKLSIGGSELVEIDVENMVRKIDGKDQLEAQRKALGV